MKNITISFLFIFNAINSVQISIEDQGLNENDLGKVKEDSNQNFLDQISDFFEVKPFNQDKYFKDLISFSYLNRNFSYSEYWELNDSAIK